MKMSKQTKKYRLGRFLFILDWICCFGVAAVLICMCIGGIQPDPNGVSMKEKLGTIIYGFGMSLLPMVVLAILVKDKIKPTIWMADLILANYLYGSIGMYIIVAVWLVCEYIIMPLSKRFSTLYIVNKEMDKRV